jgi:hypothetical protein
LSKSPLVKLVSKRGRVIYSEPNTGSGVEFQGVEPHYQSILEEWLLEATSMDQVDKGTD